MTLGLKLTLTTVALFVSLVVIGAAALWGLNGLSRDLDGALQEYTTLREVYQVGVHVAAVRSFIASDRSTDPQMAVELEKAITRLEQLTTEQPVGEGPETRPQLSEEANQIAWDAKAKLAYLQNIASDPTQSPAHEAEVATTAMNRLGALIMATQQAIKDRQTQAEEKRRTAITLVASIAGAVMLFTIALSVWQYRSVMSPLNRMRRGVREIAAGQFEDRVAERGDREFRQLAADFNRMAAELEGLYRNLEQKVADTSRELVRSERLASVGFLAAGVAHEINNPLGIMAGHAELALRKIERGGDDALDEAEHALRIVGDESYRCKQIIQQLLSMSRASGDMREPVSIGKTAHDVVELVRGIKRFRDREIELRIDNAQPDGSTPTGELTVLANAAEVKQALLNLTINALDAVEPPNGQVWIEAERRDGHVALCVRDNGSGMSAETLEHVFEPFYTRRADTDGVGQMGTGLGLSITHAIVQSHGGHIRAESDGPGRGSRFIVEWPAGDAVAQRADTVSPRHEQGA